MGLSFARARGAWLFASLALLYSATAPTSATPNTISVAEVRPGMRGYGLSVFRGTEPERFDVEVIDVLHKFRPDQDLILIRTPHPLLDHTGGVAGMSGSPVYLDGRLAGAYAYGWQFAKDPIAGVTPIANMLAELGRARRPPVVFQPLGGENRPLARLEHATDPSRGALGALEAFVARAARAATGATATLPKLVPVATPLLISGMTEPVVDFLAQSLAPLGLAAVAAGPGGGAQPGAGPAHYVDGGAIGVQLMRGDVQATGIGTVTHVDQKRTLAFGHPMLGAGEAALPTTTARVLHVLASERMSFKMAEALTPLGALVHDRQAAIVIEHDAQAPMIPVRIRVRGLEPAQKSEWNIEVVRHRFLSAPLVLAAVASALGACLPDQDDVAYKIESTVVLSGLGAQRVVDEGFSPVGVGSGSVLARLRAFDLIQLAFDNPFGPLEVERVDMNIEPRFGHEVTELLAARAPADEVDPGSKVRVVLTLQRYLGVREERAIEVEVPAEAAGESIEIHIVPGSMSDVEHPIARSVRDSADAIKTGFSARSLVVSLVRPERGMRLLGHVAERLPASAIDALTTSNDTARSSSFASWQRSAIPMGSVMTGRATLKLDVRQEPKPR